jgi:phosphoribosyl 1,2-cyclic phosphodiesterase
MIEAMTEGGFKKRGIVFCPSDCLNDDPVILRHAINFPERIEILQPLQNYRLGKFEFLTSIPHRHPVNTFGLKFYLHKTCVALLTDTKYFAQLEDFYKTDILIIAVVFFQPRPEVEHLCLQDAEELIARIKPKKAILTHFGMTMLSAKPHLRAQELSARLGIEVEAAYDGMALNFT